MKKILRSFLIAGGALFVVNRVVGGFDLSLETKEFLLVTAAFTLLSLLTKPVAGVILHKPSIILTSALEIAATSVLTYLLSLYHSSGLQLSAWDFSGAGYFGFIIPPFPLTLWEVAVVSGALFWVIRSAIIFLCD